MQVKVLNYISRKLHIDASYLAKGGILVGIASAIAFVNTFIISVVFANLVPPELYGTYKFVFSVIGVVACFSLTGVVITISKSVAQGFEGTYLYLVRKHLKYSLIPISLSLLVAGYYLVNNNPTLATAICIAGLIAPLLRTVNLYGAFLEGKKLFKQNVTFQFFYSIIPTSVLLISILLTQNLVIIIASYLIAQLLINTIIAGISLTVNKPNKLVDETSYNFTKHLTVMGILGSLTPHLDKVLIFHFYGPAPVALYTIATALPQQSNVVTKGIKSLLFPKISQRSLGEIRGVITKRALLMFLCSVLLYAIYFLSAPLIFNVFFPKYTDGILLSQVYALTFLLIPSMLYKFSLYAHTKTKELYWTKLVPPIFSLGLMFVLLPWLGLWGAVLAILTGRFVETFLFVSLFYMVTRKRQSAT